MVRGLNGDTDDGGDGELVGVLKGGYDTGLVVQIFLLAGRVVRAHDPGLHAGANHGGEEAAESVGGYHLEGRVAILDASGSLIIAGFLVKNLQTVALSGQ